MDDPRLLEQVSVLVANKKFEQAEKLLLQARSKAATDDDAEMTQFVLSELVELYCVMEPPNLAKAETFSIEREKVDGSARSKLQTAMLNYHSGRDPARAVTKLQEAVAKGRKENDNSTIYTALGLLGRALLDLNRTDEAVEILRQIERLILAKSSFVVGDETIFLEAASAKGIELPTVKRIASFLAPVCEDGEFKNRLKALAES